MDPVELPSQDLENTSLSSPEKITLKGEIQKGVEWIIFVVQLLKRMGGPMMIVRSLWFVLIKLLRRTLSQ